MIFYSGTAKSGALTVWDLAPGRYPDFGAILGDFDWKVTRNPGSQ